MTIDTTNIISNSNSTVTSLNTAGTQLSKLSSQYNKRAGAALIAASVSHAAYTAALVAQLNAIDVALTALSGSCGGAEEMILVQSLSQQVVDLSSQIGAAATTYDGHIV